MVFSPQKVQALLAKKKLTISEFHRRLIRKGVDVTYRTVSNWVNAVTRPHPDALPHMAAILDTTIDGMYEADGKT